MIKWIWLSETLGTGSIKTDELIDVFGSADGVYNATESELKGLRFLTRSDIEKLRNKDLTEAERLYDYCEKQGYRLICPDFDSYPERFRDISARPILLYLQGELPDVDHIPSFSIVGTRQATAYGAKIATMMAMGVAQAGGIVTSGMAEGIDTFAHNGALKGNGKTIAVFGCGLDICYPKFNEALKELIAANGCIITEYSPKTRPSQDSFPIRNRLIAALSEVTVIVEAHAKSGSLITANYATEQGRTVYAVPGDIDRSESAGPNRLIIEGARPLVTVRQLIKETLPMFPNALNLSALDNASLLAESKRAEAEFLGNTNAGYRRKSIKDLKQPYMAENKEKSELYKLILSFIGEESLTLAEIAEKCNKPLHKVATEVTALERDKEIELLPTGRFIIKDRME